MSRAPLFYNALPQIFERARSLRREMTKTERLLWKVLRRNQLDGYYFRRQHPVGPFIADFYCDACKLVVEVDGETHESDLDKEYDAGRDEYMRKLGITILRFKNGDVIRNMDWVIAEIQKKLKST